MYGVSNSSSSWRWWVSQSECAARSSFISFSDSPRLSPARLLLRRLFWNFCEIFPICASAGRYGCALSASGDLGQNGRLDPCLRSDPRLRSDPSLPCLRVIEDCLCFECVKGASRLIQQNKRPFSERSTTKDKRCEWWDGILDLQRREAIFLASRRS